jgi:hypothetical protein
MSNVGHTLPTGADAAPTGTPNPKLLPIGYFSAVAIAMAGWLWAIGWAIYQVANWLFA